MTPKVNLEIVVTAFLAVVVAAENDAFVVNYSKNAKTDVSITSRIQGGAIKN